MCLSVACVVMIACQCAKNFMCVLYTSLKFSRISKLDSLFIGLFLAMEEVGCNASGEVVSSRAPGQ